MNKGIIVNWDDEVSLLDIEDYISHIRNNIIKFYTDKEEATIKAKEIVKWSLALIYLLGEWNYLHFKNSSKFIDVVQNKLEEMKEISKNE